MKKIFLFPFLILVLAVSLCSYFILDQIIPSVMVSRVDQGMVRDSVTGNLKVYASSSFDLTARANGQVDWVALLPLAQSLSVQKNQPLVKLLHDDLDRKMDHLLLGKKHFEERQVLGSSTEMLLAIKTKELSSMNELAKTETVASYDLELIQNEIDRLSAQVKLEKLEDDHFLENYNLQLADLNAEIEKRLVRSPITGDFTDCYVAPGNQVFNGNRVGKVYSKERILEVLINEEDFWGLRIGLNAGVTFFSNQENIYNAVVTALSSTTDSNSGTRKLYLKLVDEIESIPVGSSGKAEIIRSEQTDALLIPRKALVGDYVVVEKSGYAEFRKVEVGAKNLLTVEIRKGLKKGEIVVVETPHQLKDGERIKPILVGFKK